MIHLRYLLDCHMGIQGGKLKASSDACRKGGVRLREPDDPAGCSLE